MCITITKKATAMNKAYQDSIDYIIENYEKKGMPHVIFVNPDKFLSEYWPDKDVIVLRHLQLILFCS